MSLFLLCLTSNVIANEGNEGAEPKSITAELLRLESIRLSDHATFVGGLTQLAEELNNMSAYQFCHYKFLKAYQKAFSGATQQAIDDVEEIIPLCEDLRARIRIDALIANLSALSGDYKKASQYIDNAIKKSEQTADQKSKAIAYIGASMVYNLLDQKELSVKYSELMYDEFPSEENFCRVLYSKNMHHLDKDESVTKLSQIEQAAQACRDSGNFLFAESIIMDAIKRELTDRQISTKNLKEIALAIEKLRPAVAVSPYKNNQTSFAAIEARFALLNGRYQEAEEHALQALEMNRESAQAEYLVMALEVLEDCAKQQGDFIRSYDYLVQRNQAELKIYNQSQSKQIAFMTVKHTNLSKVFEIEQLNRQKEVLELEKRLANQETNNQRLAILLILIVMAFMALLLFRIKKKHDYFKDVSEIDHLTKVLTRKAFEDQVKITLAECQQKQKPLFLAIIDLDHFKVVNDTHGHLIGDWVLKNVIYSIKPLVEENMILSRLGGEEFCVVVPGITDTEMYNKMEVMRQAIQNLDCSETVSNLKVTASFGYTSSEISGYSLPLLLTHADVALFEAKRRGRNQIVVAQPETH